MVIQEKDEGNERGANEQTDYNVEETEYNNRKHRSNNKSGEREKRGRGRRAFKRIDDDPASRSRVNSGAMHPENHETSSMHLFRLFLTGSFAAA